MISLFKIRNKTRISAINNTIQHCVRGSDKTILVEEICTNIRKEELTFFIDNMIFLHIKI